MSYSKLCNTAENEIEECITKMVITSDRIQHVVVTLINMWPLITIIIYVSIEQQFTSADFENLQIEGMKVQIVMPVCLHCQKAYCYVKRQFFVIQTMLQNIYTSTFNIYL
jgi:hypothetical protein